MSNLLKQCYVVSSGTGTRIINSNDGVRQKLKELQQEQAPEQVDVSAEDGQEMQNVSVGKRKKKPVPCMKNKRNSDTKRGPDAGKKN